MFDWNQVMASVPRLSVGAHEADSGELCAMEMVAFLAGEPHSDHPECTCPILAAYTHKLNDLLDDGQRQSLLPLIPRLIGTRSTEHEAARLEILIWGMRDMLAHDLEVLGLDTSKLRAAQTYQELMRAAEEAAWAAEYAGKFAKCVAEEAAWAAAWAAAWDAARDAAWAAMAAARAAACAAAWAAGASARWDRAIALLEQAIEAGPNERPGAQIDMRAKALIKMAAA